MIEYLSIPGVALHWHTAFSHRYDRFRNVL